MEDNLRIADLISAYLLERLTPAEEKELNDWLKLNSKNRELFDQIVNEQKLESGLESLKSFDSAGALTKIKQHPQLLTKTKVSYIRWTTIAAAASVLLFLSIGGYFLLHKQTPKQQIAQNQPLHNDIAPGGNKAILTLGNGKKIVLTDAKNGTIAKEDNKIIKKGIDGTVSYEANGSTGNNRQLTYNTVTTPRGGQWPVVLPDGTKVILDAASSIKYPVSFNGNERKVEITGQVYFEVAHNTAKPFRVTVKGQTIEDLGTHFDINAYEDEPAIKTTLLEGSVKVSKDGQSVLLKPGQEAILQGHQIKVADADIELAVAWKNGLFQFDNAPLPEVMRQLSRWYDVDITYEGKIPDRAFSGKLYRNVKASQVLDILAYKKIHYRIEGKKIIITP